MARFMADSDYTPYVSSPRLAQLVGGGDLTLLQSFEPTAVQLVTDAIFERYDVATIFNASGDGRNATVVMWVRTLVMFFLWERVDDKLVPERVKEQYTLTRQTLMSLQRGDINVQMPLLKVHEDGTLVNTKTRWGSEPKFRDDPRTKGRARWIE